MAATNYKFEGWLGLDAKSVEGNMSWGEFQPKAWEETDVDIKVTHCGICGSDLHTLRSGWGPTMYPCCVGHEIVGTAVRVGSKATGGIKVGDRVGVGAQNESCLNRNGDCKECASGREQYCRNGMTGTYNGRHSNGDKSYGGYATYHRSPSHFVVKIPDGISSAAAAPMLCGGITVFSPLKHNNCTGKRVGIVGVGGLGHFGILFAKALGATKVVGISRKGDKKADTLKLGADEYIATGEDADWATKNARSLDLIVSTVSSSKMPIEGYFSLLDTEGTFVQVGAPEDGNITFPAFAATMKRTKYAGSLIGSPNDIREMLELAAEKKVQPWIEERPMKEANQAVLDMDAGNARYRYVLVNEQ
ncbi:chaperonin 10-like protein [Aspergillus californicus]